MNRMVIFLYGLVAYIVFLMSFLYAIGFVGNIVIPKSINSGEAGPLGSSLALNVVLLGLFAIQHSVMARQGFKRWWTRIIPREAERSTYVLVSSLLLLLLFWKWQPMLGIVWVVENPMGGFFLGFLFWVGWLTVLVATFMINHFDLFGLRQATLLLRQQEYTPLPFKTRGLYRWVRHPIMLGFLVAFWATPVMTAGHLLFAVATTAYILVGIFLEERDLVKFFGQTYLDYRRRVRALFPLPKKS